MHLLCLPHALLNIFQGALWIEVAPSLTYYAARFGGMDATLRLLVTAAEEAELSTGVGIGYVLSVERQLSVDAAEELAKVARYGAESFKICGRPAVVGFGLHGPEEGHPPAKFAKAFEIACGDLNENVKIASLPHAGEIAPFPGKGPQSVLDAIEILRAKRVAHGVLAVDNDNAIKVIKESNVCLDICVSSNYLLNVCATKEHHPIKKFLQKGVPCTINSDDPLLFGCSLLSEYEICRKHLGMNDLMLASCAKYSFEFSCAPKDMKVKQKSAIEFWLSSIKLEN